MDVWFRSCGIACSQTNADIAGKYVDSWGWYLQRQQKQRAINFKMERIDFNVSSCWIASLGVWWALCSFSVTFLSVLLSSTLIIKASFVYLHRREPLILGIILTTLWRIVFIKVPSLKRLWGFTQVTQSEKKETGDNVTFQKKIWNGIIAL